MASSRVRAGVAGLFFAAVLGSAAQLAAQDKGDDELRDLIARVEPSVVTIEAPGVGAGSGFVVDADGIIATCYHVIEGAKTAVVKFQDGTSADVVGFVAASRGKDLILLKVDGNKNCKPLKIALTRPAKGQQAYAFGSPKGFAGSVSDGIVSAVRSGPELRQMLQSAGEDVYTEQLGFDLDAAWLQTTAPISPGNSGGPLVNARGEVVGVNAWYRQGGQNLNFSILASSIPLLLENSEESARALAELPKSRGVGAQAAIAGDAKATQEFWTAINNAKEARSTSLSQLETLEDRASVARLAESLRGMAKVWREYTQRIRGVELKQVDIRLSALVVADAQLSEKVALHFNMLATYLQNGQKQNARATHENLKILGNEIDAIQSQYDVLRVDLSNRYSADFPAMPPLSPLLQTDHEEKQQSKLEKRAAQTLALGKSLAASKNNDAARRWYQRVIDQFPSTGAAKEAAKLLKALDAKD